MSVVTSPWRTQKSRLISLIQKFIRSYKLSSGREKQRMKTESIVFARQRETKFHEEKESRDRFWIFCLVVCCSSNVFVRWFRLHSGASSVRPLFRAHSKMGDCNFLHKAVCPVSWGCRIHWLHLCRRVRTPPPNECPRYDTKQLDGEVPAVLEL